MIIVPPVFNQRVSDAIAVDALENAGGDGADGLPSVHEKRVAREPLQKHEIFHAICCVKDHESQGIT